MTNYRVLLLEDNPGDARLVFEAARGSRGDTIDLTHTVSLAAALEQLARESFDVILTDLSVPDSKGMDTVRALQRRAPSCPLVVLTGADDDELALEVLREGADDFLSKGNLSAGGVIRAIRYAVERRQTVARAEAALHDEARMIVTLQRIGNSLVTELDLQKVVQLVTDEATMLTAAAFGAFFYNVIDEQGETYTLYTISGVPREAFSKFPMPRKTPVFDPTFSRSSIVRSDDITKDKRYGQNLPYHGMPKGHLPVRSYLAVPVTSRSGEVIGGLFFGHPDAGVFGSRAEQIAVGIAGWAAIAIDNARLYEAERRARAEAERANAAKSEFLATMSHELRTPLNAMIGYTELWLMGLPADLPEAVRPQVGRVRRSAQHLLQLIEEILTFSRIEAGHENLNLEPTTLGEQLETVVTLAEPLAVAKGLEFRVIAPEGATPMKTDPRKLRQILINLLSNAIKFTEQGSVQLIAAIGKGSIKFEVKDTGCGIPAGAIDEIFDPFVQIRADHRPDGTGLGLSVSRKLARMLGGDIQVESTIGKGSSFTVCLPTHSVETGQD